MQCRINPNRTRANARYSQCGARQNSRQQTPLLRQVSSPLPIHRVVVGNYTWYSVSSAWFRVWVRGNDPTDIDDWYRCPRKSTPTSTSMLCQTATLSFASGRRISSRRSRAQWVKLRIPVTLSSMVREGNGCYKAPLQGLNTPNIRKKGRS